MKGPFHREPRGFREWVVFTRCASSAWLGGIVVAWRQLALELQREKIPAVPSLPYLLKVASMGSPFYYFRIAT